MSVGSISADLRQRVDPTWSVRLPPAGAPPLKGQPYDFLGAKPNREVRYSTRLAEALSGPDAARMQPPLPGPPVGFSAWA